MSSPVLVNVELQLENSGHLEAVSFARLDSADGVRISIDGEAYLMTVATKTCVAPPGESIERGITVLAGTYGHEAIRGAILIAVNCGQEPPALQIAARSVSGAVRAWSWEITHDIQHQILDVFAGC